MVTTISALALVVWAVVVAGWAWWHRWSASQDNVSAALRRLPAAWRPDRRRRTRSPGGSMAALMALLAETEPARPHRPGEQG